MIPNAARKLAYAAKDNSVAVATTVAWNRIADRVLEVAAPVIEANTIQGVIDWLRQLAKNPDWYTDRWVVEEIGNQMEAELKARQEET